MSEPGPSAVIATFVQRRWFAPVLAALLLGMSLWVMTRAWDASLLDRFQFRQTQTALTTYWMRQDGFQLAYPMPVFGPPWSAPMEFPLYQWTVARMADATGMSLVSAARLCGIIFFFASLPAVCGLAAIVESNPQRRLLIPAALLTAPVCLFYSRAFMIESCAAAFSVWFLYAYVRSLRTSSWSWTALALATGIVAALVKVTTFVLFGAPAVFFTLHHGWKLLRSGATSPLRDRLQPLAVTALIPAIPIAGAAIWWVHFSDAIKRANPIAEMLTSENLSGWHYGTMAQRWSPEFWKFVGHQWSTGAVSMWATLPLLFAIFFVAPIYRRAAFASAALFLIGPLVFTNLFAIHEYYYFPSAFFAAAAAGFALAGLCESNRFSSLAKTIAIAMFVVIQAINFNADYATTLKHLPATPPPMVDIVAQATAKDDVVLIYGWDWNTLIPYYAERRAILIPPSREKKPEILQEVLGRLKPGQVSALVLQGSQKEDRAFIQWCTSLLNLSATPVARSPDGEVYVTTATVQTLKGRLTDKLQAYPGVVFNFESPQVRTDPRLHYQKPNPSDYDGVASPAPFAVFTPWEIQVADIAGARGVSANAPSELHFHAPAGATHIEATVGIVEGAYTGAGKTDGVDVVIFEQLPDGGRRILYQRFLNPASNPADRGLKNISLNAIGPVSGPLVFGLYPGPADNLSFDWSFWRKIQIQ